MLREKAVSSIDNISKELQQQVRDRSRSQNLGENVRGRLNLRFSIGQILVLLMSISLCFIILSTQFNLSFFESVGVFVMIAGASGLIFYLIRNLR